MPWHPKSSQVTQKLKEVIIYNINCFFFYYIMLTYTIFHSSWFVGYLLSIVFYHPFALLLDRASFLLWLWSPPPSLLRHSDMLCNQRFGRKTSDQKISRRYFRYRGAGLQQRATPAAWLLGRFQGQGSRQTQTLKKFRASFSVGVEWGHWCLIVLHRSRAGWVMEWMRTTLFDVSEISYEQRGDQAWVFSSMKPWSR